MKLITDILKDIELQEPLLFGLTVNEHLDYIRGLYSTFEEQYLVVSRLRERVQKNRLKTFLILKQSSSIYFPA